jgi:nicotinamide mononucleotide transporter
MGVDFTAQFVAAARAMSPWEIAAVLLALAYLVLAIREHVACWLAAILSTAIYLVLMFHARLYMESALQLFYLAMAVYGWYSWKHGAKPGEDLRVSSWPLRRHVLPVLMILAAGALSGYLLSQHTSAAMPYLDSLVSWGAIVATWMVARKIIQNWHYWFVIDSISVYLYLNRGLYLTALLFVLYLLLIVIGLRQWKKHLDAAPA